MSSYVIEQQSRGVGAIGAFDLGSPSRASGTVSIRPKRPVKKTPIRTMTVKTPRYTERVSASRPRIQVVQQASRPGIQVMSRAALPSSTAAVAPQVVQYPTGPGIQTAVSAAHKAVDRIAEEWQQEAALEVPEGGSKTWLIVGALGAAGVAAYFLLRKKR